MRENADQNNSEHKHFLRSASPALLLPIQTFTEMLHFMNILFLQLSIKNFLFFSSSSMMNLSQKKEFYRKRHLQPNLKSFKCPFVT